MRVTPPEVEVGTPDEYRDWVGRLREALRRDGAPADALEQIDARYNYRANTITLYRLSDPTDPLSIAQTLSHEFLHAVLFQLGESWAARMIDLVARPVGSSRRVGGV